MSEGNTPPEPKWLTTAKHRVAAWDGDKDDLLVSLDQAVTAYENARAALAEMVALSQRCERLLVNAFEWPINPTDL